MKDEFKKRRYDIVRSLLKQDIDVDELMRQYNIFTRLGDLDGCVAAFVYRSKKDRFYIIISQHLSPEAQKEVLFHELRHIIEDMPPTGYILGMDLFRSPIEKKADAFLKEIAAAYAVK